MNVDLMQMGLDAQAASTGKGTAVYRSARCPICSMSVIVWKRKNLKASLLRALALADHVKTLHPRIA